MDRNTENSESPLLLKLPKSMLSFSDMSGNPLLMPVAVESVSACELSSQTNSKSKKQGDSTKVPEAPSVCQLQQPLLMRRSSSPVAVPYSESNAHAIHPYDDCGQNAILDYINRSPSPLNQNCKSMNWHVSNTSVEQSFKPDILPLLPNQSTLLPDSVNQPNYFVTEISNLSNQSASDSQSINFSSNSHFFVSSGSSMCPATSSVEDGEDISSAMSMAINSMSALEGTNYSELPVIAPSTAPAYYHDSGINMSQISNPYSNLSSSQNEIMQSTSMTSEMYNGVYEPVKPHWLFKDIIENKEVWCGFSIVDSGRLEMAFQQDRQAVVPVDGGRYDAILKERIKKPVYFEALSLEISRSTWFYRLESSQRFIPFPEVVACALEQHYSACVTSGQWQKRIPVPGIGNIIFESPQVLFFYKSEVELWPTTVDSKPSVGLKPVKRGLPESIQILESERDHIDHLVFIVQGIGSFCDLRFRTVTECVDGFRGIAHKLLSSHFKHEIENGRVGRVEFLPLAWHAKLHTSDKGFDRCMQDITLPSIPKLRHFTNDTLLDILLYSSPIYCQSIIDTVASDLNRLYEIFCKRNPDFSGKVFVSGHSLGSLILFDILAHQQLEDTNTTVANDMNSDKMPVSVSENNKVDLEESIKGGFDSITSLLQACQLEEYTDLFEKEKIDLSTLPFLSNDDLKDLGLPTGPRKKLLNAVHSNHQIKNSTENGAVSELPSSATSQFHYDLEKESQETCDNSTSFVFPFKTSPCMQSIIYPKLQFKPACFFALGSPISMFLTVRGYDRISENFKFPTCPNFFHIFHPYDPVAYRIECLIDHDFSAKPVLIPHHKGRKRMHLEIRENLSKVGFEIRQRVLETLKYTWDSLSGFAKAHTFPSAAVEAEVDKLVSQQISESEYVQQVSSETSGEEIQIGSLNGGRRIDYVLQEKPIEALNDYIFALTSHATYWDSEDTLLMILKEIYATDGIVVSSQSMMENRPLIHPDQSPYEAHSSNFNPCSFENVRADQATTVAPYDHNIPPAVPAISQSMQMFNNYNAPVPHITSSMPPLSSTTISQQPVGPPPLSGFVKKSPFSRM